MTIKASDELKNKIKKFEGFSAKAYKDSNGKYSVGYGINSSRHTKNTKVSKEQAEIDFQKRVEIAEKELGAIMPPDHGLSQTQVDALLDVHFNIGMTKMQEHGFVDAIRNKGSDFDPLFDRIAFANGKASKGLNTRRDWRKANFKAVANAITPTEEALKQTIDNAANPDQDLIAAMNGTSKDIPTEAPDQDLINAMNAGIPTEELYNPASADPQAKLERENSLRVDRLIKESGGTKEEVTSMIDMGYSDPTIVAEIRSPLIKKQFPVTAKYGVSPKGADVINNTGVGVPAIESAVKYWAESDYGKAVGGGLYQLQRGAILNKVFAQGRFTPEDIKTIRVLDQKIKDNAITDPDVMALNKSLDINAKGIADVVNKYKNTPPSDKKGFEAFVDELSKVAGTSVEALDFALNMISDSVANPYAFSKVMVESSGTTSAAFVLNPVAGVSSALLTSVSADFNNFLEKYTDKKGNIDYESFSKDKELFSQARTSSLTYGSIISMFDLVTAKVGGKVFSRVKSPQGKAAVAATGAAIGEPAGEGTAMVGAALASGTEIDAGEVVSQMALEGIVSGPMTAGRIALEGRKLKKAINTVKEANKANTSAENSQAAKEGVKQTRENMSSEDQKEVMREAREEVSTQVDDTQTDTEIDENIEIRLDEEAESVVEVDPSKFPDDVRDMLDLDLQDEWDLAKSEGRKVTIPKEDWVVASADYSDDSVIFGTNEMSVEEAEADAVNRESNIFYDTESNDLDVEEDSVHDFEVESEPETVDGAELLSGDDDQILRPVILNSPFKELEDIKAFDDFKASLQRANPEMDANVAHDIATLYARNAAMRAKLLGAKPRDVLKTVKFKKDMKASKSSVTTPSLTSDFFSIVFNATANPITAVHELGHVFLHQAMTDALNFKEQLTKSNNPSIGEYNKAIEELTKLLGITDIKEYFDPTKIEKFQEKFAGAMEDYFVQDKAPDSRIATLMKSVKDWLLSYWSQARVLLRSYPALQVNDKLNTIMDGIFDTSKAATEEVYSMFPDPKFPSEMMGKEYPAYLETLKDARSEAIANVYGKAFKNKEVSIAQGYDILMDAIREDVDAEMSQERPFKVLDNMTRLYGGFKKGDLEVDPRINYESAVEVLFDGDEKTFSEFKKVAPRSLFAGAKKGANNGVNAQEFLDAVGYSSPQEFMADIDQMVNREAIAQQRTEQIFDDNYQGLFPSEEEVHRIAENEVNVKGRKNIVKKELGILFKKYPTQAKNIAAKLMKDPRGAIEKDQKSTLKYLAEKTVLGTKVKGFSPKVFMRNANKARNESAKAFKSNDVELAIERSMNEAIQLFAHDAANKVKKQLVQAISMPVKLQKAFKAQMANRNKMDIPLVAVGVSKVAEIAEGNLTPIAYSDLPHIQKQTIDTLNSVMLSVLNSFEESGDTVGYQIEVGNLAKSFLRAAVAEKEIQVNDKQVNVDSVVSDTLKYANDNVISYLTTKQESRDGKVKGTAGSFIRVTSVKARQALQHIFPSLADFNDSVLAEKMHNLTTGSANVENTIEANRKRFDSFIEKFPKESWDAKFTMTWDGTSFNVNGLEQVLATMLYLGSDSGAKKLLQGKLGIKGDVSGAEAAVWAQIDDLYKKGKLTDAHFDFVQDVWNFLEDQHGINKDVLEKVDGMVLGKIEPKPIILPNGKPATGGYYPIFNSSDVSVDEILRKLDTSEGRLDLFGLVSPKSVGMLNTRTEAIVEAPLSLYPLDAYMSASANIQHTRQPLSDITKILYHEDMQAWLNEFRPGLLQNVITPWISRVKNGTVTTGKEYDAAVSWALKAQNRLKASMFFVNLSSIAKQQLGHTRTLKLAKQHWVGATTEYLTNPIAALADISLKSDFMKNRFSMSQTLALSTLHDYAFRFGTMEKVDRGFTKAAFSPIQMSQNMVDAIAWKALYNREIKKGSSEAKAIRIADDGVLKSQGSTLLTEMPNMVAGSQSKKLLVNFLHEPLTNYEYFNDDMAVPTSTITRAKMLATTAALTAIIPSVLIGMGGMAASAFKYSTGLSDDEGDDIEDVATDVAVSSAAAILDSVAPSFITSAATSAFTYGVSPSVGSVTGRNTQNVVGGVKSIRDLLVNGDELTDREVKAISDALYITFGVPFPLLVKPVLAITPDSK